MIKKILIGGIITTITLITNLFVDAYSCNLDKSSCWDFNFGEYENSNGYKGAVVDNNLNFYGFSFDYYIGDDRFLSIWWQDASSLFTGYYMTARNTNLDLNLTSTNKCDRYWICSSRPPEGSDPGDYCSVSFDFSQLSSLIKDHNRYLFNCRNFGTNYLGCSVCSYNFEGGDYVCLDSYNSSYQIAGGIGYEFASKEYINTYAVKNPYSSNFYGGNLTGGYLTGGIELNTTESALKYFEDYYGWNENICYVGIDNITTLWGSSVPFQEGSGLDIFEVFEGLYGNTDLYKMYPWLNSWIINYTQRSLPSEDRLYLANYNSGTNQVDLYYDNLTFPFTGKPVALYFMADEVSYFTNNQTMGSDVVSYCYIKLKGGTYEDIIDNSTKQSINQYTEKYNTNKGLNPDGTVKNIDYSGFGHYGSGELTGDNSLKGILERLFGDFDMLQSISVNSSYKILPDWLIISFIFVVLFKLLRKK